MIFNSQVFTKFQSKSVQRSWVKWAQWIRCSKSSIWRAEISRFKNFESKIRKTSLVIRPLSSISLLFQAVLNWWWPFERFSRIIHTKFHSNFSRFLSSKNLAAPLNFCFKRASISSTASLVIVSGFETCELWPEKFEQVTDGANDFSVFLETIEGATFSKSSSRLSSEYLCTGLVFTC